MGWREVIFNTIFGYAGTNDERTGVIADAIETRLLDMLETDRIALARELLPPGFVVAREVAAIKGAGPMLVADDKRMQQGMIAARASGWSACRAAMLEQE